MSTERLRSGRHGKPVRGTAVRYETGKSDSFIVPENHMNKAATAPEGTRVREGLSRTSAVPEPMSKVVAECEEGRELAKGNLVGQYRDRTQRRAALQSALDWIRQAVRRNRNEQMTNLWHHVYNEDRLLESYLALKPGASAGVDGVTWSEYGEHLEENLRDLSERLKRGAYKAKPVLRVYIPKADGRQRPIGIPALEDKIVQRATAEVLNAVYEEEFLGFSYGFRPGRSQHQALDALWVGLVSRKVNWVLDMDIRGIFDAIDHEWLVKMVEHRIGDKRVVRHVQKWLKAGVLEDGRRQEVEAGTPQGGSISPLLANIYLHYSFDQWAHRWRKQEAHGEVIIVRYADDIVMGFEHRKDAESFRKALEERLRKFNLELHPDKTRLLEFGRYASERRSRRGAPRPETFNFLGFVHICGTSRKGNFVVRRHTIAARMRAKLQEVKRHLKARMHMRPPEQGKWLGAVLRGYYQYYAVSGNMRFLDRFRWAVQKYWYRALNRRSHKARTSLERMSELAKTWLPVPNVIHPCPLNRLRV